jgi:hypothetical protein
VVDKAAEKTAERTALQKKMDGLLKEIDNNFSLSKA